uniref:Uncharacterized protein n=1 Tax=uncultured Desulfobacterium sp. TaxID=201089 RepID=E1YC94_9BACT|nr:unknown protein [uncultured Desulfobacterium sp.]
MGFYRQDCDHLFIYRFFLPKLKDFMPATYGLPYGQQNCIDNSPQLMDKAGLISMEEY